jgi:ATP-dependent DNA ligase
MARRNAKGVRLYTRNGNDCTKRFPLVVAAVAALPVRSCLLDGEVIVSNDSGLAVFDLIRSWHHDRAAVLCAFDLLELDGQDLRRLPIERRKQTLAKLLRRPHPAIALNEHYVGDGALVLAQACKPGCEAIVSKRIGSFYRSGQRRRADPVRGVWSKCPSVDTARLVSEHRGTRGTRRPGLAALSRCCLGDQSSTSVGQHYHFGSNVDAIVQVDHIGIEQANASARHMFAD